MRKEDKMTKVIYMNDFENKEHAVLEAEILIKRWYYDEIYIISKNSERIIKIVRK